MCLASTWRALGSTGVSRQWQVVGRAACQQFPSNGRGCGAILGACASAKSPRPCRRQRAQPQRGARVSRPLSRPAALESLARSPERPAAGGPELAARRTKASRGFQRPVRIATRELLTVGHRGAVLGERCGAVARAREHAQGRQRRGTRTGRPGPWRGRPPARSRAIRSAQRPGEVPEPARGGPLRTSRLGYQPMAGRRSDRPQCPRFTVAGWQSKGWQACWPL